MGYESRNINRSGITNVETGLPEKLDLTCYKHSIYEFWSPASFRIWHNLVSHYCESVLTSEANFFHSPPDCLWNIFFPLNPSQNTSLLIPDKEWAVTLSRLVFMLKHFYKTFYWIFIVIICCLSLSPYYWVTYLLYLLWNWIVLFSGKRFNVTYIFKGAYQ